MKVMDEACSEVKVWRSVAVEIKMVETDSSEVKMWTRSVAGKIKMTEADRSEVKM